ncbi:hypothetical protein N0V82_000846 [Gnomoniopsis sp. IMI 355080]|nr:hypothetical protein N0V82_000846 [Gnomoniopsis sp. IMI 355080]
MTESHELHRRRRKPLEPFFSRAGIGRMEGMIKEEATLLNDRLEALQGSDTVVRLDHIFSAFAGDMMARHIEESKRENVGAKKYDESASNSIFRYIVTSDMPASEQSTERLSREAMVLFGAGTATTARTMGFVCFYLLTNPHMKQRLSDELAPLMADYPHNLPKWSDLEKLPYLQAVITEGLR